MQCLILSYDSLLVNMNHRPRCYFSRNLSYCVRSLMSGGLFGSINEVD